MRYTELKEAGNYSAGDGAGSSHPDAPSQPRDEPLLPDQQLALDRSLYRQYHNASKMSGATPMEFKAWLKNKSKTNESIQEAGMGFQSQSQAVAHVEEKLQDIQHDLEREVEWVLTDYLDPNQVHKMIAPVQQGITNIIHSLASLEPNEAAESVDPGVARIVELSGLGGIANRTTFAGTPVTEEGAGIGMGQQRMLDQMLSEIEMSISRAEGRLKQYAVKIEKMRPEMTEDEEMHYAYGVQAMIDLFDGAVKRLQKLG